MLIRTSGLPLLRAYLLTLAEWTHEPPPAPSWRELLVRDGISHQTKDEIENVWLEHAIWIYDRLTGKLKKVIFELGPIPLGIRGEIDKIERETRFRKAMSD